MTPLECCAQVVDASSLMQNFASVEQLRERRGPDAIGVDSGDERQVVDLMLDQIEFADVSCSTSCYVLIRLRLCL